MELQYGENNFIKVDLPLTKVFHDATLFGDGTRQRPLRVLGGGGSLPDQTGNSGKYLTTNGTTASWATVPSLADGDKGDITVSASGATWTIDNSTVTLAKMANLAANSIVGNNTGSPATPIALTVAQTTAMLDTFTSSLKGLAPSSGGGTTNFLRADGTWAAPPATAPAGSNTEIQFNNAGAFGASANLYYNGLTFGVDRKTFDVFYDGVNSSFRVAPSIASPTAGTSTPILISPEFSPTSGTAVRNYLSIVPTINQTGGANGITRGLHILPTLTSAADWRAIEATGQTRLIGTGATSATSALLVTNSAGTETLRIRDDGEVLINKDLSVTTQSSALISVQSADANTNLVLFPKGTGAIIAGPPPNGTATGGNARGSGAVDLQTTRSANTRVASGSSSTIGGGTDNTASAGNSTVGGGSSNNASGSSSTIGGGISNNAGGGNSTVGGGSSNNASAGSSTIGGGTGNTASGSSSTVGGGSSNIASAINSTVAGGLQANASLYGQHACAAGRFAANSDAQASSLVMRQSVTGTATTELFLDGTSIAAILPLPTGAINARAWNFTVNIVGICATSGGTPVQNDVYSATYQGAIKRVGSTTSLVGTVELVGTVKADTSMSGCTVTIDANDTNESLRVQVAAPTGDANTVIRWVAKVELVEVGR